VPQHGTDLAMERLRQRADFLAAATAAKVPTKAFVLQARKRGESGLVRVGFTVSRKVGTAVERNRVRRRLKQAVARSAAEGMRTGHDYVLVGRRAALHVPFERLIEDLAGALRQLDMRGSRPDLRGNAKRPTDTPGETSH
jgi:ribonuclease P protein component